MEKKEIINDAFNLNCGVYCVCADAGFSSDAIDSVMGL